MKQSRTVVHAPGVESPRHLPLVDLLVDARSELFELTVRSGLKVLENDAGRGSHGDLRSSIRARR